MQSISVTIDFPIKLLRYQLKEYLEYNFKVYIKKDDTDITVFGSPGDVSLCQEHAEYFKSLDSQFLLHLNVYSKQALTILNLKLFYQSRCKVLMSVDENVLYIFGQLFNVTCIYNYLCQHTNKIENESDFIELSENEEMDLNVMCRKLNIVLPQNLMKKTRIFIYNILKNGDDLLKQFDDFKAIQLTDLPSKFNNLSVSPEKVVKNVTDDGNEKFVKTLENDGLPPILHQIQDNKPQKYRTIIIDGSNVAFEHGNGNFSPFGVKFAVDYFVNRGAQKVYAFLPRHRQGIGSAVFPQLELSDNLKYTPSRKINNVRETPYDDRVILDAALAMDGVVLSNDQYRDLMSIEKYQEIICKRLIPYTFVEDHIIVPDDPRGPNGPCLEDLLTNTDAIDITPKSPRPLSQTNHFRKRRQSQSNQKQCSSNSAAVGFYTGGAGGGGGGNSSSRPSKINNLKGHQIELYRRVHEIFPSDGEVIKNVILANPHVSDLMRIINMVMMATKNNK